MREIVAINFIRLGRATTQMCLRATDKRINKSIHLPRRFFSIICAHTYIHHTPNSIPPIFQSRFGSQMHRHWQILDDGKQCAHMHPFRMEWPQARLFRIESRERLRE